MLPSKIYAEAIARSPSGHSLLSTTESVTRNNARQFYGDPSALEKAGDRLSAAGFEVLDVGRFSISIAGSPAVYQQTFQTQLTTIERPVIKEIAHRGMATFIDAPDTKQFGKIDTAKNAALDEVIDGVAINEPVYYFQRSHPSPIPPTVAARYLQVPDDIATGLNASRLHQQGIRGQGMRVVMVDTGWYRHPYFSQHGYRVNVVLGPGSSHPEKDDRSHGTGESANLLAIAPEVELTMVKADIALENKYANVNSIAAFKKAVSLNPHIISCSWGSDLRNDQLSAYDRLLGATVADAVGRGIVVVFASGNGHWGFPAQHPDVIAAGGVYWHLEGAQAGQLEASNYASGFISSVYRDRRVPDVCGLVGKQPHGTYILLPVAPGSQGDRLRHEIGDLTSATDGWAAFSGTSAAAPQVAGICALIKQVNPQLSPERVKDILQRTARDISRGRCNDGAGGHQAQLGPDLATGHGLADAQRAIVFLRDVSIRKSERIQNFNRTVIRRVQKMADYPKLRENLEEILQEFDVILEKKISKGEIEAVELDISEANFVARSPQTIAISALVKLLTELKIAKKTISERKTPTDIKEIKKKHIFAAKSLLKIQKYRELATKILVAAMQYPDESELGLAISDAATEALGEFSSENISVKVLSNTHILDDNISDIDLFSTKADLPQYGRQNVVQTPNPFPNRKRYHVTYTDKNGNKHDYVCSNVERIDDNIPLFTDCTPKP